MNDHSGKEGDIMLDKVKEEIKTVQTRVLDAQEQIVDQADDIVSQARHRVHLARGEGAVRLWNFENQALDWVDGLLERSDVPGGDKVREPVAKLVGQARASMSAIPIDGYPDMNARTAASAVRTLGLVDLLKVEQIETASKARKTVFEAIERQRKLLQKPPFRASQSA
jgi:hypothetical protein